jgi:hypothetical protein
MVWCPLRDIKALLAGGQANVTILEHKRVPFFQCAALHYLCRPVELEDLTPFAFYSDYEVVRMTSNNCDELLEFSGTCYFRHPSYCSKKQTFLQGVRKRSIPHLVKVCQYDFPDTAQFGGSLMDEDLEINDAMEMYSELVLLLFCPYRSLSDVRTDPCFTTQLRKTIKNNTIDDNAFQFLQRHKIKPFSYD